MGPAHGPRRPPRHRLVDGIEGGRSPGWHGLAAGLALAFGATRVMASLLFGVPATDPAIFVAVAVALGAVSLAAAWVPGRRATQVDPMVALRSD
jgi:putative ABC transport system permease protein